MIKQLINKITGQTHAKLTKEDTTIYATFYNRKEVVLADIDGDLDVGLDLLRGWVEMGWKVYVAL